MQPVRNRHVDPAEAVARIPAGARVLVSGATGESRVLSDAVMAAGDKVAATFTGIFVPGVNKTTYLPNVTCRTETFFMTPELAARSAQVDFMPLCYQDISTRLEAVGIDAALMMVSPPDARGRCGFGLAVDFLAEVWARIPLRIAHINPLMPVTNGPTIPIDAIDTCFERAAPPLEAPQETGDEVTLRIARSVAALVPNGATLQTGLGKLPGAILRALIHHRDLRIHSGLIGDAIIDLAEAGALAPGVAVTAGVAIGSERLYRAISGDAFAFRPVSVTHAAPVIAAIARFVSINSALEVDLLGQAYAEVGPNGLTSGPGGASDFARAARLSKGGLRIVALRADAKDGEVSRIVAPGAARGPVSLGRFEIDIVVTEHGAADLRGLGYDARARALVAIASPDHRDRLASNWADYAREFSSEKR